MRLLYSLISILLLIPALGQGRVRHYAKHAQSSNIDSLYFFEPVGGMGLISFRNEVRSNDSLTLVNQQLQKRVISHHANRIKLAGEIALPDGSLREKVRNEVFELLLMARKKHYFEDLAHPSIIDSIMDASHRRFALLMLNLGFARTDENKKFVRRQANMKGFVAFTGGLVGSLIYSSAVAKEAPPRTSSSDLYVMIIDAQENKTYFFDVSSSLGQVEYDPLDVEDINAQFRYLFEGFFFPKGSLQRI